MANEVKVSMQISFAKSGAKDSRSWSFSADVAGDVHNHNEQSVGTTEEEIAQGTDLGTPGLILIINQDSTNYVEVGSTTGVYDIKLLAGEAALYRHNSATIYAKANSSACLVEYFLVEL